MRRLWLFIRGLRYLWSSEPAPRQAWRDMQDRWHIVRMVVAGGDQQVYEALVAIQEAKTLVEFVLGNEAGGNLNPHQALEHAHAELVSAEKRLGKVFKTLEIDPG